MRIAVVVAAALALTPGVAAAQTDAVSLSRAPIAEDGAWKQLVLDQNDGFVYVQHVHVVAGDASQVENPDGLTALGGGVTTIHASGQGTPRLALDLGINTGGYVEVGVTKTDGTTVHLGYSEARQYLSADGDQLRDPSQGDPGPRADDVTGTGDWRSPGVRGAQRWISLQLQGAGTVSIDYVRVREEHLHPVLDDYTGHFLSSDDQVNRTWYASAYTFALDSYKDPRPGHDQANTVIVDGAKRDRLIWLGDLVVENALGDYSIRQAPRVVRDSLQAFSCQQGTDGSIEVSSQAYVTCPDDPPPPSSSYDGHFLPEYTAWWVVAVHDYDLLTGDDDFARRMLPVARRAVAYFTSSLDANGLYSTPGGPSINWHPFDVAAGEDTHTNAAVYRALLDLADLERRVGDGEGAAAADDRQAAALRQAMLDHLWDPAAGAFLLNPSDPASNHTEDAQVEAVYDGVVTGAQADSALRFVQDHLWTTYGVRNGESDQDPYMSNYISPYIGSTELLARFSRHDAAGALDLLRREWGHMVDTDPQSTVWERIAFTGQPAGAPYQVDNGLVPGQSPSGDGFTSLAHGWAGGPVPALSGYVLGIRPVAPGFATWLVEPQVGDLRWAQGQAPAPRGPIVSRWARGEGDSSFRLTAGGPAGTTGTVAVPLLGADRTIARDGKVVWSGGRPAAGVDATSDGAYVRFAGQSGIHTWAWSTVAAPAACASRRRFVVHLRAPRGFRVRSARITVAGRSRRAVVKRTGRRIAVVVDLRGLPRRVAAVRVVVRGRSGRVLTTRRTYHPCTHRTS